jgi:dolichol-phosphate mannosyltransferase
VESHPLKAMVMIPTYQERDNIGRLLEALPRRPDIEIVVVDDSSPDGTWRVVEERAKSDPRIRLLKRETDRGRGTAGRAGYLYCLTHGADLILEMDADFSHDPGTVEAIVDALKEHPVVLGSRFVKGGVDARPFSRKIITRLAGAYIRLFLGVRAKDPTSGFRGFQRRVMEAIAPERLEARDPFIVTEVLYRIRQKGFPIHEIPIRFEDRKKGETKLRSKILFKNLLNVLMLRLGRKLLT